MRLQKSYMADFHRTYDHSMTILRQKSAFIRAMQTQLSLKNFPAFTLAVSCIVASPLRAAEKPLREILRDGLYAEEVSHDPTTAAKSYEDVLARYGEERAFAASALFRLAEVRRKQDRENDAIHLYQRLLTEFPQAENETKLAQENLAALGGKLPETNTLAADPESKELARLQALVKTSPDVLRDPNTLINAVKSGFQKAVAYLLSAGAYPFAEGALATAAGDGNLAIVKQLLATGVPIPEAAGQAAVSEAVRYGRIAVLSLLLERGAKFDYEIFNLSITWKQYSAAELLLKHGADPNAIRPASNGRPRELRLNDLINSAAFDAANWLLDHGAKPELPKDLIAPTPLCCVISSFQPQSSCLKTMERLLKAGADANRPSIQETQHTSRPPGSRAAPEPIEVPLYAALDSSHEVTEKVRLLLAHGANPNVTYHGGSLLQLFILNQHIEAAKMLIAAGADLKKPGLLTPFLHSSSESNLEALRFLLTNGADPNIPDGIGKVDQTGKNVDSLLEVTGKVEDYPLPPISDIQFPSSSHRAPNYKQRVITALELTQAMLDAGAKAGPFLGGLLNSVAIIDEKGDVFGKLLAQRPAKVPVNAFPNMETWQAVPRQMYLNQALIPTLKELPDITLLERETGKRTTLAAGGEGKTLPTTLDLLREKKDLFLGGSNPYECWPEMKLARKGEEKVVPFDLNADAPLPELRAGDVLEVTWGKQFEIRSLEAYQISYRYDWAIEKRISFPITLEIDGKAREILLRGDLLSFDPSKDEAPRVDAASLIALFLPDGTVRQDSLIVKRKGWNDIRPGDGKGFSLQKGDRFVIETESKEAPRKAGERVRLVSPGVPFSRSAIFEKGPGIDAKSVLPTLLQLLTDAYAPNASWTELQLAVPRFSPFPGPKVELPRENAELFPWVATKEKSSDEIPVVLSHPDFSAILIRRTDENGKESILKVNLAEAIAACTAASTPEQARAADVVLKNGDVVELPTVADQKGKVWEGFSSAESRFFHKALAGQVLVNIGGGQVQRRDINYQPPDWRISSHGTLPLPPTQGMADTRLLSFGVTLDHAATIQRGGIGSFDAQPDMFVRDGDQIDLTTSIRGILQPRPRLRIENR
jgi:ankyrin repeat protein